MIGPSSGSRLQWIALVVVWGLLSPLAGAVDYIRADARIAGKEMYAFSVDGENATVVLGDFRLTVGDRVVSGRDAVLWIRTTQAGQAVRHDITVYVEGDAAVAEPGGAKVTDRTMLVTIHCEGRLKASGILTDRKLTGFPLYKRALAAREAPRPAAPKLATKAATKPATRPARPSPASAVKKSEAPRLRPPVKPGQVEPAPKMSNPKTPPAKDEPAAAEPINFSADQITSELKNGRRVTIARGKVYLSRGSTKSDEFVELRSQAAVIFTESGVEDRKDSYSPFSPKLAGAKGTGEAVTGVYLEGDVVIARGERYFRGPAAFYDFTTDRAIIIDPVFRTVQEQRDIPIYIRASEARILSAREMWFADAKVSTSEFYTPTYHIGARTAYVMDDTPYDAEGRKLGEQAWNTKFKGVTLNVRGIPFLYLPVVRGNLEQGNSALRSAQVGKQGGFGWGMQTEWHLFRLLGLIRPEGFDGRFNFDWMEDGVASGVDLSYARDDFSGYHLAYGMIDDDGKDEFGTDRDNIPAPRERGRVLMRHKQFLPNDWQLQFELSYICDRNFMETFFPDEHFAGKEQETLLYARKQKDNWAFTSLVKYRLNRFDRQAESWPDLGLLLIGEPLAGNRLTFFHESHAGIKRFRLENHFPRAFRPLEDYDSDFFVRLDTREEISLPMHIGPINLAPYAVGRATYWGDEWPDRFDKDGRVVLRTKDSEKSRPYGQVGLRASTHVWRVFENVESRIWDLHGLRHIITPEVVGYLASASGVTPEELFPMDREIEGIERTSGMAFNVYQRLQTKRGPAGNRHDVDWMRFNVSLGIYDNDRDNVPADGRFFWYRPENSSDRNHLNTEYFWQISDSTMLLADTFYDLDDTSLGRANIGLAVQRDPRLRYYAGIRYIDDADSAVGTFGVNYKISRKYSISAFEQYDFDYENGRNLSTTITITRKLPRWFAAFTFSYDNSDNEVTMLISLWPEGIPDVQIGGAKLSLLGKSDKN